MLVAFALLIVTVQLASMVRRMLRLPVLVLVALQSLLLVPIEEAYAAPGDSLLVNADFSDGLNSWNAYPNSSVEDGTACISVDAGAGAYSAAIEQQTVLLPNAVYRMEVVAYLGSGSAGPIRAVVQVPGPPYSQYLPEVGISGDLESTPQTFVFEFETPSDVPTSGEPNAAVLLQQNGPSEFGYSLCVESFSLVEIDELTPYQPDTGPRVRVNHMGYFVHGPKRATLVSSSEQPVSWELFDGNGSKMASGRSKPRGLDPSAGLDVHVIDFSSVRKVGPDYVLVADGETSFPFAIGMKDTYQQLRYDALNYYYPARSGIAIDGNIAGESYAREAGHISAPNGASPNQGDFQVPCQSYENQTNDAGDYYYGSEWTCPEGYTLDVVGGWYDAGDHGKYVVNGGISVAQLMGIYERALWAPTGNVHAYRDGTLKIPEFNNGVPDVLDEARWELEWMMSMQIPAGSGPQTIDGESMDVSGMVHHKIHDEGWTGLPLMPADASNRRSLHRPSTAATLNVAAAAAQGARVWAPYDPVFADKLLQSAKTAYRAAKNHPAIYAPGADGSEGGGAYSDGNVEDEFYWAAAELYLTTGARKYKRDLRASALYDADVFSDGGFGWNSLAPIARMNLATVPNDLRDRARIRTSVRAAAKKYLSIQYEQPFGQPYSGSNGEYIWGSNSQLLNIMMVMSVAYDISGKRKFRNSVLEGMDYIFGRNALGWSYVTGYGESGYTSENQHSRWWANQLDPALPNPPPGTIAGGPNSGSASWDPVARALFERNGCFPQTCYVDDIGSWATNELTINWNAPMAWVASFLADQAAYGKEKPYGSCKVSYRVNDRWRKGPNTQVVLTNTGSKTIKGWELTWPATGNTSVVRKWAGRVTQDGPLVTVKNEPWNKKLKPGRSVTVRLSTTPGALHSPTPTMFRLNGKACRVK